MSIETSAGLAAEKLERSDFVRVFGHHDADGIAAASIICHALYRNGKKFHLSIKSGITPGDIRSHEMTVLCDLGSSIEDLPEDTVVIDHHMPCFNGEYHINPRLFGINGEKELASAAVAYMVADHMGDNRDLCSLALLGMIGDHQEIAGKNSEIVNEGIANQFITPGRGIPLAGDNMTEKIHTAVNPYLPGISGNLEKSESLVRDFPDSEDQGYEKILSAIILEIAEKSNERAMCSLWGNTWELQRGIIHDAHTLASVIESCGLSGRGGLGALLCMGNSEIVDEAKKIGEKHRLDTIQAVDSAKKMSAEGPAVFEIENPSVSSTVADILAKDGLFDTPVFTVSRINGNYSI
ncbi:MAG: DHH family phosphoesterase, partial [Methanomicrobiaceae archaeon]|nr:DHH family phosphoesterase [Methanomicrobiaceae archaeon]